MDRICLISALMYLSSISQLLVLLALKTPFSRIESNLKMTQVATKGFELWTRNNVQYFEQTIHFLWDASLKIARDLNVEIWISLASIQVEGIKLAIEWD